MKEIQNLLYICFGSVWLKVLTFQKSKLRAVATTLALWVFVVLPGYSQSPLPSLSGQSKNYVSENTILKSGVTQLSGVNTLNVSELSRTVTYVDGLGRPVQQIAVQGSPGKLDVISAMNYDNFGRQAQNYLPFTLGSNGHLKANALAGTNGQYTSSNQYQFYQASGDGIVNDAFPYSETTFEDSPFSEVLKTVNPGTNWHQPIGGGTAIGVESNQYVYRSADHEAVRLWLVDFQNQSQPFSSSQPNAGDYDLWVQEVIDEHGNKVQEFMDKRGRTVLKRVFYENNTKKLETYYVYDDFGDLRLVIPPKAVTQLKSSNWNLYQSCTDCGSETILEAFCFISKYDSRRRIVEKKVPGAGWAYLVYDELDRLVASQDAKQRDASKWLYAKYDIMDRPVETGFINTSKTLAQLQSVASTSISYQQQIELIPDPKGIPAKRNLDGTDTYGFIEDSQQITYQATQQLHASSGQEFTSQTKTVVIELTDFNAADQTFAQKSSNFPVLDPGESLDPLSFTFYDDYDLDNDGSEEVSAAPNTSWMLDVFNKVKGAVTATKVKILDDPEERWLTTVSFYDDRGRVTQTQADNHLGGTDIMHMKYNFVGWLEMDKLEHKGGVEEITIYQEYTYDHAGRLLKTTHQIGDDPASKETLVELVYNELGELIEKKMGNSQIQNIDYAYNIRGWMTHINDSELQETGENDLFGMELIYESQNLVLETGSNAGTRQYNGNIAAIKWQTALGKIERAYAYEYDDLNRLLRADYAAKNSDPGGAWDEEMLSSGNNKGHFSVWGISYDENSNILSLNRNGLTDILIPSLDSDYDPVNNPNPDGLEFGVMDQLTYAYRGNQLAAVADQASTSGVAGDFQDKASGTQASPEYAYDINGNLVRDDNKGITSISYNHLNLPSVINFTGGNSISYIYDAAGIKLQKIVSDGSTQQDQQTDYVGGFIYQDYALEFLHTPEGRVLPPGSTPEGNAGYVYEYHYKDHLGNLRLSFREGKTSAPMKATMETEVMMIEEKEFANLSATRDSEHAASGIFSAKLNGAEGTPMGPWKSIPIAKGDELVVTVEMFYEANADNRNNSAPNFNVFLQNSPNYGSSTVDGQTSLSPFQLSNFSLGVGLTLPSQSNDNVPNAYLAVIIYDEDGNVEKEEYRHVQVGDQTGWGTRTIDLTSFLSTTSMNKGRAEVFVYNQSNTDIWFDNLTIQHKGALIAQENHYYPFGMNITSLEKSGQPEHRFQFMGIEKEENFGLNWIETEWRGYNAQIGRFHQVDPLTSLIPSVSPYNYAYNNPISLNDPLGLIPESTNWEDIVNKLKTDPASLAQGSYTNLGNGKVGYREISRVDVTDDGYTLYLGGNKILGNGQPIETPDGLMLMHPGVEVTPVTRKYHAFTDHEKTLRNPVVQSIRGGGNKFMYGDGGFIHWLSIANPWTVADAVGIVKGISRLVSRRFIKNVSSKSFSVGSGGEYVSPMKIVREVRQGEKIADLVTSLQLRTQSTGVEHAIVRLGENSRAPGVKVIVSGGSHGISFLPRQIKTLFGHTHPFPTGPSAADREALRILNQSKQYIYEGFNTKPIILRK